MTGFTGECLFVAILGRENHFSDSNTFFIRDWSSTSSKLLTSFFAYADEPSKDFIWLISGNNYSSMTKPGILILLIILFGRYFPFVFSRRKQQRTRDAKKCRRQDRGSENGSALANVSTDQRPYKPQESAVSLPKKHKKQLCLTQQKPVIS